MKAIVTGANGFVGSNLVKKLINENIQVIAIDVNFNNHKLPISNLIKLIQFDSLNFEDIKRQIDYGTCDVFYHLAWNGVNGEGKSNFEVQISNLKLSLKYAQLAYECGCKKFLSSGTVAENSIYSLPDLAKTSKNMMYATAKYCNHIFLESYCKSVGLDFIWMQFSNIYGPINFTGNLIDYTLKQLIKNEQATFGPSDQFYDFIFIDDLIEAVYRLGTYKTNRNFYFIGSGKPRVLKKYLYIIGKLSSKTELIKIGYRSSDGIKYSKQMFGTKVLVREIGNYISGSFEHYIMVTINEMTNK
jgi:nucleoside-diphosphate-sugar epimerase